MSVIDENLLNDMEKKLWVMIYAFVPQLLVFMFLFYVYSWSLDKYGAERTFMVLLIMIFMALMRSAHEKK